MTHQPRKMSEVVKEMAERLLRNPGDVPSSEAAHVALLFANIAWNESVGLGSARPGYRPDWEMIEAENPDLWAEFKSTDVDATIDDLIRFKEQHYPDDGRRILTCGIPDGKVRVEWLPAAAPGVDSQWEMTLYGLVRTGERQNAIQFLRATRRMSRLKNRVSCPHPWHRGGTRTWSAPPHPPCPPSGTRSQKGASSMNREGRARAPTSRTSRSRLSALRTLGQP